MIIQGRTPLEIELFQLQRDLEWALEYARELTDDVETKQKIAALQKRCDEMARKVMGAPNV